MEMCNISDRSTHPPNSLMFHPYEDDTFMLKANDVGYNVMY